MKRIVHYVNQFFAGLGGEESAGSAAGCAGRGSGRSGSACCSRLLGEGAAVVATVHCGDDHFSENEDEATARLLELVKEAEPDLLFAGPAFGSGRYGLACAGVCRAVGAELGIPVLTAMSPSNPGADLIRRDLPVVATGESSGDMRAALEALGRRHREAPHRRYRGAGQRGRVCFPAAAAGTRGCPSARPSGPWTCCWPSSPAGPWRRRSRCRRSRRWRRRRVSATLGTRRSRWSPPAASFRAATRTASSRTCPPTSVPTTSRARSTSPADDFESVHGGFFTAAVNDDPNRLIPLDVLRDAVRDGSLGGLHEYFYSTTGNGTPVETAAEMAQEYCVIAGGGQGRRGHTHLGLRDLHSLRRSDGKGTGKSGHPHGARDQSGVGVGEHRGQADHVGTRHSPRVRRSLPSMRKRSGGCGGGWWSRRWRC